MNANNVSKSNSAKPSTAMMHRYKIFQVELSQHGPLPGKVRIELSPNTISVVLSDELSIAGGAFAFGVECDTFAWFEDRPFITLILRDDDLHFNIDLAFARLANLPGKEGIDFFRVIEARITRRKCPLDAILRKRGMRPITAGVALPHQGMGGTVYQGGGADPVFAAPPLPKLVGRPGDLDFDGLLDFWFRQLQTILDTLKGSFGKIKLVLLGGGNMPVPSWFIEWCADQGILVDDYTDEISGEIKSWLLGKQEILTPGAALPEWPGIEISEEDPPFFKHNPAMKKRYEEDQDWIFDGSPDFESLLGCYFSLQKKIVLWRKGIELCARRMGLGPDRQGLPVGELTRCVLVHELGHWFCDVAVVPSGSNWDPLKIEVQINGHDEEIGYLPDVNQTTLKGTAWSLSSRSFHEVWAQWFAWLFGQEVDRGVLDAFVALEARQSTPYRAWRKLVSTKTPSGAGPYSLDDLRSSQEKMLKSLEWARALRDAKTGDPLPATFHDRKFPHTNLLDHLFP